MNKSTTILNSWKANAGNWIATIDNAEIELRRLVTNGAEALLKNRHQLYLF